ncbi:MAG: histidinol-phosphate transaminase [Gemmatimonadota bacterium]
MTPFPRPAYRPLARYAPDRRPIEADLSDNTNRWGAHPAALRAIREAEASDLTRYPSVYADALRAAIARRFGVPQKSITTGCGSDDMLDSTFRASGEPGEAIVYFPPTFSMVEVFARMNGMVPRPLPAAAIAEPARLLEGSPALLYLCRPNNPTGEVLPKKKVERLIAAIGDEGPILLIDEAYADFADDNFLKVAAASARVLVVRTLSKAYGLAGLRVGFAVGSPQVIAEVEKSRGPYKVNRLAELAGIAVLEDREKWIPKVVSEVRAGRARLKDELQSRGLVTLPSGANFLLLPLGDMAGGVHSAAEATAALRERGVAVRPFPTLPGIGDTIRISIGPWEEMERFLEALDEVLA